MGLSKSELEALELGMSSELIYGAECTTVKVCFYFLFQELQYLDEGRKHEVQQGDPIFL